MGLFGGLFGDKSAKFWSRFTRTAPERTSSPVESAKSESTWGLASFELEPGQPMTVSYRTAVPDGIERERYGHRVTIRFWYPDRGDDTELPTTSDLGSIRAVEDKLASDAAVLVIAKTGEGNREATFQVVNADSFLAALPDAAASLAFEYDSQVATDPTWSTWRTLVKQLTTAE